VHLRATEAGAEADGVSYTRFLTRVEKRDGRWLVSGLRDHQFHLMDMLISADPVDPARLDVARLGQTGGLTATLPVLMSERGQEIRTTLPGMDLPETVQALTKCEENWLEGACTRS
jgi:cephalosporin-C deacetylase-like acetyl esterase